MCIELIYIYIYINIYMFMILNYILHYIIYIDLSIYYRKLHYKRKHTYYSYYHLFTALTRRFTTCIQPVYVFDIFLILEHFRKVFAIYIILYFIDVVPLVLFLYSILNMVHGSIMAVFFIVDSSHIHLAI